MRVILEFRGFEFYNKTMDLTFYEGYQKVFELNIVNSTIDYFPRQPVTSFSRYLKSIRFSRCKFGYIDANIFIHYNIKFLVLIRVVINRMSSLFLENTSNSLMELLLATLPVEFNIQDLFHSSSNWKIQLLELKSSSPKFHLLSADNFTSIRNIIYLSLVKCGIRVIEPDAFKYIENTLSTLNLMENCIRTLDFTMFYKSIEQIFWTKMMFNIDSNPLVCSCEFNELKSVLQWHQLFANAPVLVFLLSCQIDSATIFQIENCPSVDIIHPQQMCIHNDITSLYKYPKFKLKLSDIANTVIVETSVKRKYRLWIYGMLNSVQFKLKWGSTLYRCPKDGFVSELVTCLLLSNQRELVVLPTHLLHMLSGNFAQICVSYVSANPKKMWPLHCIVINDRKCMYKMHDYSYLLYLGVSFFGVSFSMVLLRFIY